LTTLHDQLKQALKRRRSFQKTAGVLGTVGNAVRNPLLAAAILGGSFAAGRGLGNRFPVDTPELDLSMPEYTAYAQAVANLEAEDRAGQVSANTMADVMDKNVAWQLAEHFRPGSRNRHMPSTRAANLLGAVLGGTGSLLMRKPNALGALLYGVLGSEAGSIGHSLSAANKDSLTSNSPASVAAHRIYEKYPEEYDTARYMTSDDYEEPAKQARVQRNAFQKTAVYPGIAEAARRSLSDGIVGGAATAVGVGGLLGLAAGRLGRWNTKKNLGSSMESDPQYSALSEYLSTLPDDPGALTDIQIGSVRAALKKYKENRRVPFGTLAGAITPGVSAVAAVPLARKLLNSNVIKNTFPELARAGHLGVNAPLAGLAAILAAGAGASSQLPNYRAFDQTDPVLQKAQRLLGKETGFQEFGAVKPATSFADKYLFPRSRLAAPYALKPLADRWLQDDIG